MDGVECPTPRLAAFQESFGPLSGQLFSRPVSFEIPVRSGPRNWGQSEASAAAAANIAKTIAPPGMMRRLEFAKRDFRKVGLLMSRTLLFEICSLVHCGMPLLSVLPA